MLKKISHGMEWLQAQLARQTGRGSSTDLCAISFNSHEILLGFARYVDGHPILQFLHSYPCTQQKFFTEVLAEAVKKHQLTGINCKWVLLPDQYQLFSIDALPVPESEFQAAIRWKLKSMIQYPIEDVVVDHFPIPTPKTHDPKPADIIITARASFLKNIAQKIKNSGLNLINIDIQELALRNITALYENDSKTTALLYMQQKMSGLLITCQKTLYFHRQIDLALSQLKELNHAEIETNPPPQLDKTALDLQRSFDYYQSQWRQPAPARYFLATTDYSLVQLTKYFSNRLAISFDVLNVHDLIAVQTELDVETQGRFLPVIGGILHDEYTL